MSGLRETSEDIACSAESRQPTTDGRYPFFERFKNGITAIGCRLSAIGRAQVLSAIGRTPVRSAIGRTPVRSAESRKPKADGRYPFSECFKNGITAIGCRLSAIGRTLVVPLLALVVVFGFTVVATYACNVPVFRFALERWRPDAYRVTLFHRGPLADSDRALIETLEEPQVRSSINLALRTIDVSELNDADRELFSSLSDPPLPMLVAQYPANLHIAAPVWSAPLDRDTLARLTDSPIRRELVRRLAAGQTAVWLLLESGQFEQDAAAATLLQEQLKRLEQELKLPELTDSSEDKLLSATPLQVAFSVLRVPRSDAEQPLIQMLLHCESDLAERSDPMVFPVFGRGRALLPLIGAGITSENIQGSATFLVGACSCEVKEQNPGFDLLLTADWNDLLTQDGVPLLASETRSSQPSGEPELVSIPSGALDCVKVSDVTATAPDWNWLIVGVIVVGVLVIIVRSL